MDKLVETYKAMLNEASSDKELAVLRAEVLNMLDRISSDVNDIRVNSVESTAVMTQQQLRAAELGIGFNKQRTIALKKTLKALKPVQKAVLEAGKPGN